MNYAENQRQYGAEHCTPTNSEAFGLPDDKGNGQQENQ
jgi:hypothetical protein